MIARSEVVVVGGRRLELPTLLFVGLALLVVTAVLPRPWSLLSLPLLLVVPGWAILTACFGIRVGELLLELALAVVLSLAAIALLALAVHASPFAIHRWSMLTAVAFAVLVFAAIGVARPAVTSIDLRAEPVAGGTAPAGAPPAGGQPLLAVAFVAVVLLVATLALVVARIALPDQRDAAFSTLALAGASAEIDGPVERNTDGEVTVEVTVANHTDRTQEYTVTADVAPGTSWDDHTVSLAADETGTFEVAGPVPPSGCLRRIELTLEGGGAEQAPSVVTYVEPTNGLDCTDS